MLRILLGRTPKRARRGRVFELAVGAQTVLERARSLHVAKTARSGPSTVRSSGSIHLEVLLKPVGQRGHHPIHGILRQR